MIRIDRTADKSACTKLMFIDATRRGHPIAAGWDRHGVVARTKEKAAKDATCSAFGSWRRRPG